jgi:hypothetical protein
LSATAARGSMRDVREAGRRSRKRTWPARGVLSFAAAGRSDPAKGQAVKRSRKKQRVASPAAPKSSRPPGRYDGLPYDVQDAIWGCEYYAYRVLTELELWAVLPRQGKPLSDEEIYAFEKRLPPTPDEGDPSFCPRAAWENIGDQLGEWAIRALADCRRLADAVTQGKLVDAVLYAVKIGEATEVLQMLRNHSEGIKRRKDQDIAANAAGKAHETDGVVNRVAVLKAMLPHTDRGLSAAAAAREIKPGAARGSLRMTYSRARKIKTLCVFARCRNAHMSVAAALREAERQCGHASTERDSLNALKNAPPSEL